LIFNKSKAKTSLIYFVSLHTLIRHLLLDKGFNETFYELSVRYFPLYNGYGTNKMRRPNIKELEFLSKYVSQMDERGDLTASCLSVALTVQTILYSCGIDSFLVIGIKKVDEKIYSHAWVELTDGTIIDPQNESGHFKVLNKFLMKEQVRKWVELNENMDSYVGK